MSILWALLHPVHQVYFHYCLYTVLLLPIAKLNHWTQSFHPLLQFYSTGLGDYQTSSCLLSHIDITMINTTASEYATKPFLRRNSLVKAGNSAREIVILVKSMAKLKLTSKYQDFISSFNTLGNKIYLLPWNSFGSCFSLLIFDHSGILWNN